MREITVSDAKELSIMHCKCFKDGWSEKSFTKMLSKGDYFGFISKEGFVFGRNIIDETEVFAIGVLPEFRKQGFGYKLLNNFHKKAETLKSNIVFLEVDSDNIPAQKLYLSIGYKQISIRKNYYGHNSAIIMNYKLTKN